MKRALTIRVKESISILLSKLKPYRRPLFALMGVLLVSASSYMGYGWFYKLAPMRHLADRDWKAKHSALARWEMEEEKYRRSGASPDLFMSGDRIGYYGDKHWLVWLIDEITNNPKFGYCGCTKTALAYMTNQQATSWGDWLKTNRDKSQEEWIRDGFEKYGIRVHLPPESSDTEPLLKILGCKTWRTLWGGSQEKIKPDIMPDFVQYNAFRWLRDSGFNPTLYAISNSATIASNNLAPALINYSKWENALPSRNEVGILEFGRKPKDKNLPPEPRFKDPWFMTVTYTIIFLPLFGGIALLALSIRGKKSV